MTAPHGTEVHPARMTFEAMYHCLDAWQRQHLTCHVPHRCFDAPALGAWVRWLRSAREGRRLEQWKVDRLDRLGFEWKLSPLDAKWHALLHQLRRFKEVHGHVDVPWDYEDEHHPEWAAVGRWLRRQGQLMAKGLLAQRKQDMLGVLGVRLAVDTRLAARYVRLQGLNGHERKLLRRRWKAQRAAESEAYHAAVAEQQSTAKAAELEREEEAERRRWVLRTYASAPQAQGMGGGGTKLQTASSSGIAAEQDAHAVKVGESERVKRQMPLAEDDWYSPPR